MAVTLTAPSPTRRALLGALALPWLNFATAPKRMASRRTEG